MRFLWILSVLLLLLSSCQKKRDFGGKTPLVEAGGQVLFLEDLTQSLPAGLSGKDSARYAENYIHNWVEDVLLYEKAQRNVADDSKIEALVSNYRKALVIHTYQQNLIAQKLANRVSDNDVKAFYEQNRKLFVLDKTLIKGLFIKVPMGERGVHNVRTWCHRLTPENVEKLEKFSLKGAVDYTYFLDKWTELTDVTGKIPSSARLTQSALSSDPEVEVRDKEYWYFLHVTEMVEAGNVKPLDYAYNEVKEMLMNQQQVDFMQQVKDELVKRATDKNDIIYYYKDANE